MSTWGTTTVALSALSSSVRTSGTWHSNGQTQQDWAAQIQYTNQDKSCNRIEFGTECPTANNHKTRRQRCHDQPRNSLARKPQQHVIPIWSPRKILGSALTIFGRPTQYLRRDINISWPLDQGVRAGKPKSERHLELILFALYELTLLYSTNVSKN